jgi:hypothetical protein
MVYHVAMRVYSKVVVRRAFSFSLMAPSFITSLSLFFFFF